jgi:uncharacterized repeat protein (TIGR03803 family)
MGCIARLPAVLLWGAAAVAANAALATPAAAAGVTFTTIHSFTAFDDPHGPYGENPSGPLLAASDGYGCGVTCSGGRLGKGSLYRLGPDGAVSTVHSFKKDEGECPSGRLTQASDGNLYGTAIRGGAYGRGTVFRLTPAGELTVVHAFRGGRGGESPGGGVVQASDGQLYGLSDHPDGETVYRLSLDGDLAFVYLLDAYTDGYFAVSGLTYASNGFLYGQTLNGGQFGHGAVFRISLAGQSTVVHAFGAFAGDSASPRSGLAEGADAALYGTTEDGGTLGSGTLFRVGLDDQYAVIHNFDAGTTGDCDATPAVDAAGNVYVAATWGIVKFAGGASYAGFYRTREPAGDSWLSVGPDQWLYGVDRAGGAKGAGKIFRMKER